MLLCDFAAATAPVPVLRKIPKSLSEVDSGKILGFGADLAEDHPVKPLRCLKPCTQQADTTTWLEGVCHCRDMVMSRTNSAVSASLNLQETTKCKSRPSCMC